MAEAHAAAPGLDDIPFARGTMRMGLSPLSPGEWIAFGEDRAGQMAEKDRLLRARREQVLVGLPGSEAASRETLDAVAANLASFHPDRDAADGPSPGGPLEAAARLVQEDLCVLETDGNGEYRLTAGCVCFPSNWSLPEKLGRTLRHIHGPVPGFDPTLAAPVDRFFARLAPGQLVARLNWLVHDSPELFQRGRAPEPLSVTAENAGETLWLRTERQVLQRLPRTHAVLFTIRTRVRSLGETVASPAKAAELAGVLRAMPPALNAYRHMAPFETALLAWLDSRTTSLSFSGNACGNVR